MRGCTVIRRAPLAGVTPRRAIQLVAELCVRKSKSWIIHVWIADSRSDCSIYGCIGSYRIGRSWMMKDARREIVIRPLIRQIPGKRFDGLFAIGTANICTNHTTHKCAGQCPGQSTGLDHTFLRAVLEACGDLAAL
jgi:hypothetical protein